MICMDGIIEQLNNVCGLKVRVGRRSADGVGCDGKRDVTEFAVTRGASTYSFEFDGASESDIKLALLALEYVKILLEKPTSADPVRAFLSGASPVGGIRVGKSDYFVFAVHCPSKHKEVNNYLFTMKDGGDIVADMGEGITAFCKCARDGDYYRSAGEFAAVLRNNIAEEIKAELRIGVGGTAHGTGELPLYYGYAQSALASGAEFDPNGRVYSYKEYALIKTLSALSDAEKEKYIKLALDRNYREVLADGELMAAADAFIKYSLNISEASRNMYVHRNTLINRLDKIERLTGLNIRNFGDAMTFRAAYLLHKMMS